MLRGAAVPAWVVLRSLTPPCVWWCFLLLPCVELPLPSSLFFGGSCELLPKQTLGQSGRLAQSLRSPGLANHLQKPPVGKACRMLHCSAGSWQRLATHCCVHVPCETRLMMTCLCQPVKSARLPAPKRDLKACQKSGPLLGLQCANESVQTSVAPHPSLSIVVEPDKGQHESCRSVSCARSGSLELPWPQGGCRQHRLRPPQLWECLTLQPQPSVGVLSPIAPLQPRTIDRVLCVWASGRFFAASRTGVRLRPASTAFSCPETEFLLAASKPVNSCTVPRRHGRMTHQPQDVPYGGCGPDLPCHSPLSHGSSRFEVDDQRTRERGERRGGGGEGVRAHHRWESLIWVAHCGI